MVGFSVGYRERERERDSSATARVALSRDNFQRLLIYFIKLCGCLILESDFQSIFASIKYLSWSLTAA